MIPQNIKSEHILKAIEEVEKSGIPRERISDKYDLEYNKKLYPPKYIISLANKYANGKEFDHSEFSGGDETNNFLKSLGFNIIDKESTTIDDSYIERHTNDFAPRLRDYLENIYSIKIEKGIGRAHLSLPSGAVLHIRGSIMLKGRRGFYYLQEEDYNEILNSSNKFLAVVFGDPEKTFVFAKDSLKTFFDGLSLNLQEGKKPKWYFDILEDNGRHYLKVHSYGAQQQNIDNYLNKWDQIEDFKHLYEETLGGNPNYWILVVTDKPEQNLTATQILTTRINDKFWGQNAKTPYRTLLRKDDIVIFSYGAREFLGTAILDSDAFELTEEQSKQFSHGDEFFKTDFGVKLRDAELWKDPKPVHKSLDVLSFIKNKGNYKAYFQGGIRKILKEDYNNILNISPSRNLLSFVDLQKFLLEEMQMQANYQPIMIRTLLQSGGRTNKDNIAAKIKEINPDLDDRDLKGIPVYNVLENRGIVKKDSNDEFILNSEELTRDQRLQLVALCNWKIYNMPLQLQELIEAFDKNRSLFDPNRTTLDELEKLRSAFVSDFSSEKILQLELDEYVVGKHDPKTGGVNKSTFCYRLEHEMVRLSRFGVRTALDFGIYYNRENQEYVYNNKEKYGSPQEAFDVIKSEIYSILKAGEQYHIDHNLDALLDSLESKYNISRQVRSKILSLYYPEDFLAIHNLEMVETILRSFEKTTDNIQGRFFLAQAELLDIKNSHPIMRQWHNNDFSHFVCWVIIQRDSASRKKLDDQWDAVKDKKLSVWVVRAGSKGKQERDAIERNIITIAWNQLPDLSNVEDKESLKHLYFKSDPNSKKMAVSNMVGSIWRFVNKIKNGDFVVLPLLSQNSKTIAVGRVEGDYKYIELTSDIKHIRPVKWLATSIPESEFDEDTIKHLQIPMTVFQVKDDRVVNEIGKVLHKYGFSDSEIGTTIESQPIVKGGDITIGRLELRNWQSLTKHEIDDIVQSVLQGDDRGGNRLAIPIQIVKRILYHLISSKHVILLGPPGTGKTDLARRLLHELSTRIIGVNDVVEAVASYEWGRYDVIGGNSLTIDNTANKLLFHFGCVTKAIKDNKFLLIDEFNRADMNKAFGEMFLAIDHGIIQLREDEIPDGLPLPVIIPSHFRMICTMNDYDKSLLNDLSYGLLRRFSFVEIRIPNDKEELKSVIKQRVINDLSRSNPLLKTELYNILEKLDDKINKLIDFIYDIKKSRELGVSTLIDTIRYVASINLIEKECNNWKLLSEALTDYVIPQLDRLDINTLRIIQSAARNHLKDENGNTVTEIEEFNQILEDMIFKLKEKTELFK